MKKTKTIVVIILSILLVGLYTVTSTYSVIIDVIENDGITEIVNEITVRDLLINDDGSYNNTYYTVKEELELTDEEANILMSSVPLNEALKTVLDSIVEYKVHDNTEAKLTNDEIYNLITESILNTDNISDEVKSRVINKSSIYRQDISDYIYDIEVSVLEDKI
ncbi:MAG: hypothetical protein IJE89_04245 [Bacilli bacterium]|nr:hypothetical protein [Bacilli bacterium]